MVYNSSHVGISYLTIGLESLQQNMANLPGKLKYLEKFHCHSYYHCSCILTITGLRIKLSLWAEIRLRKIYSLFLN